MKSFYGAAAVSMQKERYAAAEKAFEDIYGKADNIRIFLCSRQNGSRRKPHRP
ncbi:MAG: hypothetical protein L6V87_10455 [Ruminococcus sp.]|nr:MAG: hypothetical protein L6V87_10455 [Ruminococcus sp.]